jgi:hypothetical protein
LRKIFFFKGKRIITIPLPLPVLFHKYSNIS